MQALLDNTTTNPRGIPAAPFIESVGDVLKEGQSFSESFSLCQNRLSQYQYMLESKQNTVSQLNVRIPDLKQSLSICRLLKNKDNDKDGTESDDEEEEGNDNAFVLNYELNDTLYTKATIDRPAEGEKDINVGLWLGADIMLEYPLSEAIALLETKLSEADSSLNTSNEDAEFLRENITTMEVNCARLYNHDVEQRKKEKK